MARASLVEVGFFLSEVTRVIAVRAERVMVHERSRIPGAFWAALYVMATLSLAAMGYHAGLAGTTRSPVTAVVALTFSILIEELPGSIISKGEGQP